jgi:hypothetical protein
VNRPGRFSLPARVAAFNEADPLIANSAFHFFLPRIICIALFHSQGPLLERAPKQSALHLSFRNCPVLGDFQVTFNPIDSGRSLRVTRRITDEGLTQPIVANSVYDKTSDVAQWNLYSVARDNPIVADVPGGNFVVLGGTQLVAVLNDNLSTKQARDGDRFTLTVRSPSQYEGASIEGHVAQVNRSGRVSGRAEMSLEFDRIRLRDGRASNFAGYLESVRMTSGETVKVDNEGRAQDDDSQTKIRPAQLQAWGDTSPGCFDLENELTLPIVDNATQ